MLSKKVNLSGTVLHNKCGIPTNAINTIHGIVYANLNLTPSIPNEHISSKAILSFPQI